MESFFNKTIKYFTVVILLFCVKLTILIGLKDITEIDNNTNGKVLFFGDSHIERGIKESNVFKNLAKSAQPLYFSCVQAQQYCNTNSGCDVAISFDNLSLSHCEKIESEGSDYFFNKYFIYLSRDDHWTMLINFPQKWLTSFIGIGLRKIPKIHEEIGFIPLNVPRSLKLPTNHMGNPTIRDLNIVKLIDFIKFNPKRNIYLIRMPFYLKNTDKEKFNLNEVYFNDVCRNILKNHKNVKFLDFKDEFQGDSQFFYDWDHLNSKGADSFAIRVEKVFYKKNGQNGL